MSIQEAEAQIRKIDEEIRQLEQKDTPDVDFETIKDELEKARHKICLIIFLNSVVTVYIVTIIPLSAVLLCSTICLLL